MSGEIICGKCPAVYRADKIDAYLNDERIMTLAELQTPGSTRGRKPRSRKLVNGFLGIRSESTPSNGPRLDGLSRLRSYTFKCPYDHVVDGNPGSQFGVAVLGATGASKSHVLPAIVRELDDMRALRPLGVTLRDSLYPNPKLTKDVIEIFRRGHQLGPTPPEAMLGPYSYKLQLSSERGLFDDALYSLLLYDIAGENLAGVTKIVEKAAFILLCKGLIILIDPANFLPTDFDEGPSSERVRLDAGRDVRGDIRVIADTLTETWEVKSSQELDIPICFVLAKADAIDWTGGYQWARQTEQVMDGGHDGLTQALEASSEETRAAFGQLGGGLVIDEIEECFRADRIRFAAASATSAMPLPEAERGEPQWTEDPVPNGVALSMLHVLDLAGLTCGPAVVSSE